MWENPKIIWVFPLVPPAGLEPARLLRSQDFKSCVSTNSTTEAINLKNAYTNKTSILPLTTLLDVSCNGIKDSCISSHHRGKKKVQSLVFK